MRRIIRVMVVAVFFWGLLVSLLFADMHILTETPTGFFDVTTGDTYIVPGKWVREQSDYNNRLIPPPIPNVNNRPIHPPIPNDRIHEKFWNDSVFDNPW